MLSLAPVFEVYVTPQKLANFGQLPFFIDWVSMYQEYPAGGLPVVCSGIKIETDEHGEVKWRTMKAKPIEGSFETSVQVRCDGHRVKFDGNVSRFGRTDNVWGFDFAKCLQIINRILGTLQLPPFAPGERQLLTVKTNDGPQQKASWTGARITRLDLTANYETGSMSNARAYLEWLQTQQGTARIKVGTHADGETVDWGRGSRALYSKVYIKSSELKKHNAPQEIIDYCESVGLIRFEITAKSTWLQNNAQHYLGALDMTVIKKLFDERSSVLTRAELDVDDLEHLENRALRCTARDWLMGDDLAARLSDRTFRRHRAALLKYGIDISIKRDVKKNTFKPLVRVIEIKPATIPDWYQFYQPERKAA